MTAMRTRAHEHVLAICGLVVLLGGCDPLSDAGADASPQEPRAAQGTTMPVAEAVGPSGRLPLWEGVVVDLHDVPGDWVHAVHAIDFVDGEGVVLVSLGRDDHGVDQTAIVLAEQGHDGTVDLATDYTTGHCLSAECACKSTDATSSCNTQHDISSAVETLTAYRTN